MCGNLEHLLAASHGSTEDRSESDKTRFSKKAQFTLENLLTLDISGVFAHSKACLVEMIELRICKFPKLRVLRCEHSKLEPRNFVTLVTASSTWPCLDVLLLAHNKMHCMGLGSAPYDLGKYLRLKLLDLSEN